jgi:Gpi18-like mannosyltransferase
MPSLHGHEGDQWAWRIWAVYINRNGLQNTYSSGTDYTPLWQYFLWLFGKIMGDTPTIEANIRLTRAFTLFFDFLGLWLVYKWIGKKVAFLVIVCVCTLNIANSYNTLLWGQVDGIYTTLAFAALYFLHKERLVLSAIMIVLAVNMKLQAVIFIPLWGLLLIEVLVRTRKWINILWVILTVAATQIVILLPFSFVPGSLARIVKVVSGLVGSYKLLSLNAFNIWHLIMPDTSKWLPDNVPVIAGLTYNQIGLLMFCTGSFIAFIPLLRIVILQIKNGPLASPPPAEMIWCTAALISLFFFYCNTQMHERYSHPAFIFITAYCFYKRQMGVYILFSVAYFLNMERVLMWFELKNYETFLFTPQLIAALFGACIIWLLVVLFRDNKKMQISYSPGLQLGLSI